MTSYAHKTETFIKKQDELGKALLAHFNDDLYKANDALKFDYVGRFKNLADFAQQHTQHSHKIPVVLQGCITWDKVAEKIKFMHPYFAIDLPDGVHVFWS